MRSIFVLLILLLAASLSHGRDIDYGIKISRDIAFIFGSYTNSAEDIRVDLDPKLTSHFSFGGFARYHLTSALSIQPEFLYTTKGGKFNEEVLIRGQQMRLKGDLTLRYIEFPVLLRLSTYLDRPPPPRYQPPGYTFNGYTGLSFGYNTSARFSGDLSGDVFGVDFDEPFSSRVRDQFTNTDISLLLGTGMEYGRDTWFTLDIRYAISIMDIGKDPDFSDRFRNSSVSVMIGILF